MGGVILGSYLAVALAIGVRCVRQVHTADDYHVAGRRAGVLQVTGSLVATILGSSAILGSIDWGYTQGWAGAWLLLCGAAGLLALLPLTGAVTACRCYNLPTLLGRFYGDGVRKLSAGVISLAWVGVVGAQVIGAADITATACGVPYAAAAIAIGATMTGYTVLGGQLSILRTDCLQALFVLAGVALVAASLFLRQPVLQGAPMFSHDFTPFHLLAMLFSYASTFLVGPDVYSRLFCAKDRATARTATALTAALLVPTAFLLAYVGVYGARNYPGQGGGILFVIARGEFPPAVSSLLYLAMLSAIMSSADTTLFTAGGLLAQFLQPRLDTPSGVRTTRLCIAALGAFAILTALCFRSLLKVMLFALGAYAGAFVVPVLWGLLGRRSRPFYVLAAILTGGALALVGQTLGGTAGRCLTIGAFAANLVLLTVGARMKQNTEPPME